MASALPPFAIWELRDDELLSFVQVNEQQYQSTIESHPDAALSYVDDDDGERVTIGSGLELRQRLEDPTHITNPSVHYYNSDKKEFEDRAVHVFDIRKSHATRATWEQHQATFNERKRQYEVVFGNKTKRDSISSIDLNSTHHDDGAEKSQNVLEPAESQAASSQVDLTAVLSDAIPDLVDNLANLMQTTSETLRKAAEKTRESKTSPIEDVLSGMSNIVTEIGSFGMSLLDQFNQASSSTSSPGEDVSRGSPMESEISKILAEGTDSRSQVSNSNVCSTDNLLEKSNIRQQNSVSMVQEDSEQPACDYCSKSKLICAPSRFRSDLCRVCDILERPCSLTSLSAEDKIDTTTIRQSIFMPTSAHQTDNSILDQDTEDADFSRRYPPLISLRRANTIAGLHDRYGKSSSLTQDALGLSRTDSWARRFPHRPAPEVLDEETQRRRGFARDCFPGLQYTPGPGVQVIKPSLRPSLTDYESQKRGWVPNRPSPNSSTTTLSRKPLPPTFSDTKVSSGSSEAADLTTTQIPSPVQDFAADASNKSLPGAWPESTESNLTSNGPPGESSGAFFHRMMRDNPSRKQKHIAETNERLTRYRSFSRPRSNKNPFSELNRSNTTSSASNPAARLNRPFDPTYQMTTPSSQSTVAEESSSAVPRANMSQPQTFKVPPKIADKPSWLQRPFSPVWEDDLDQPKAHSKERNEEVGPFDRNGESISMYSPPPRHMRSVPNLASARMSANDLVGAEMNGFPALPPSKREHTGPGGPPSLVPPKVADQLPVPYQVMFQRHVNSSRSGAPQLSSTTAPRSSLTSTSNPAVPVPITQRTSRSKVNFVDPVAECVRALRDMGYGSDDENLNSRLHVYAVATNGDVMEALDMIEEDKKANFGAAIEERLQMRTL